MTEAMFITAVGAIVIGERPSPFFSLPPHLPQPVTVLARRLTGATLLPLTTQARRGCQSSRTRSGLLWAGA